ncbi:MAG: RNA methyltransferase, partial [Verrucomicrobia bacterium]|nr:RNA methyltransferase [Verrucomicrobiota bacterium]
IQAVLKGRAMEWLVQKATELGVARIVPITAERTVSQLDSGGAVGRREKWRAIAVEGIKQCGSVWLPEIALPMTVSEHLERRERSDLVLVASLQPDARHPRRCLESFVSARGRFPESVSVWIGPEGDFTRVELGRIVETGAWPVTLGRSVLRSETAALYLISVLQYELGGGTEESTVGREDPEA